MAGEFTPVVGYCRLPLRGECDCGVSSEDEEPFLAESDVECLTLLFPPDKLTMAPTGLYQQGRYSLPVLSDEQKKLV